MKPNNKAQRALISLTDKSGCQDFAAGLATLGIEILSTGGTAKALREHGLTIVDVSDFTGFPEMLDGRVKTLHPLVHGAILHRRDNTEHRKQCQEQGIQTIDIVAVNLYAFDKATAKPDCSLDEAIEQIDIGGPALLRAAAKNFRDVTVLTDPADYSTVLQELQAQGQTQLRTRFQLARKVFALTAAYDTAISRWLARIDPASAADLQ